MADINNEVFSSLDPLGPEYGKINQPTIDSKGLSAFEGDRIEMPKINFPESDSYFPTLPNADGLTSPQKQVRQNIVGQAPNKPGVSKKPFDYNSFVNDLKNKSRAQSQTNQDNNVYAKVYSYDASPDGNAFYKRYQAYGQETFDKIGFSPLRDNEALFNANTTWWDDHKRMMTQSFWPLFGRGFISGPKSLGKMLTGDFTSSDIEDAEFYSEAAAIGNSTKGGFGGFVNNTLMNFGYSAGIMSEAILEEVAGVLLAPETMGGSFFVTTANLFKNTGRAIRGLDAAVDGYKAVNATLKSVESVAGARKFWQGLGKVATPFNPVGGTMSAFKAAKATDNLTNLGKGFKTFGGFYRDTQRINMALAEARLEGGMVKNSVYDKLYNQYYAKNGKAPTDEEQYAMIQQSEKASLNTVLWNAGLIYGSNAITFPNIMGPKGGIRNFVKNNLDEIATVKGGKYGDIGKWIYNKGKNKFEFEANNFKNMAKGWLKQPGYKALAGTVGYFKSNFAEGIQENLQEVIAGANERYYVDTFNSPVLGAHEYSKAAAKYNEASKASYFGQELGKQFTATGFETFASGFAMGALATPVNFTFEQLAIGFNKMYKPEVYQEFKKEKLKATKEMGEQLNGIDIKEFLNSRTFNYSTQDNVAQVKKKGTVKEATDATLEGLLSQVHSSLENGTLDLFKEKLKHMSELTPEEFEDATPTVPKGEGAKYQSKIPDTLKNIDKIKQRYDYYNERFPNPVNGSNFPDQNSPDYKDAVALHYGWKEAVKNAVFFNEAFEDTMARKTSIMEKYLSKAPLKNMSQRDSEVIFDYNKLRNEQAFLKEEVASLEGLTDPESQRQLAFKKRKLEALQTLGDKTAQFNNFFNRYERAAEVRASIKNQKGEGAEVTDEEVEKVLNDSFGEFTEENKIKMYSEHEASYKDYLRALASLDGDHIFDQDIDDSYALLADHFKLDSESRSLMEYVNLLHDPKEFMEAAERNRTWMKDLYNKRGAIYEKMIKEQLNLVIDNALLNELANKGVYISLEEFQNWKDNGEPPTEFFDNSRKIIIPEGTEEYNQYYRLFEQASQLKDEKTVTVPESLDIQLKADLEKADADMKEELDNLPKKEVKVSVTKLKTKDGVKVTLAQINNELQPGQYADANYEGDEPLVLFKDTDGSLKLEGPEGEPFKDMRSAIDFVEADIYTLSEQADPELVKPIEEKYAALKNQIREDYAAATEKLAKEEAMPVADFVPITPDLDSVSEYPVLYRSLFKSFEEKVLSKISDEEFVNMTDDQQDNLFNKFLQTDKDARNKIDEFNKNQKLQEATKETGEKGEFEYIYQGKKKNTEDIKTVAELRRVQRRFKALVTDIEEMENPTADDLTDKSKYKILITDFEKLIATRSRKGLTPELRAALDKANALKDKQGDIEVTAEGITVNGEEYQTAEEAIGNPKEESIYNTYIDEQINNLFGTETTPQRDEKIITQEAFDSLFGPKGYLTTLKQRVDNGELSIISQDLIVYDPETKVASTIHLLVADTAGNLTIVDVIPDSKSNWDIFKKKDNPNSKLEKTKLLMATKANLLKNMIGVDAKVSVLPIEMSVTTTDNKILTAGKPSSATLLATDFLINLNTVDVQDQANEIVPVTEKKTTSSDVEAKKADIKNKLKAFDKTIENEFEEGDYLKVLALAEKQVKDGTVPQTLENIQLLTNYPKLFEELIKATDARNKTIAEFDKEKVLVGEPNALPIYGIESTVNSSTGRLDIKWVEVSKDPITNIQLTKINNYAAEALFNYKAELQAELADLETNVVPVDAESSDDVQSPAVVAGEQERKVQVIDDAVRYRINDFKADLDKVNSKQELQDLLAELSIKNTEEKVAFEDLQEMSVLARAKAEQLNTTTEVKIVPESLTTDSQFVAKNTIFTQPGNQKSGVFAETDDTVVIDSINKANKTVTVSSLGALTKMTIGFNELNNLFTLKEVVMDATQQPAQTITKEDKVKINESTDLADAFVKDSTQLDKVEGTASSKSLEELDEELLEDIEC
jgi:hypothetical protein